MSVKKGWLDNENEHFILFHTYTYTHTHTHTKAHTKRTHTHIHTHNRGSIDDKIHFVFDMYNVSHDKTVSKQELSTLLNHVPKEAWYIYGSEGERNNSVMQSPNGHEASANGHSDQFGLDLDAQDDNLEFEELDYYTNHDMVEKAFAECDLNHEGRLTYEEFKMWVQRTPMIMDYIESILPYNGPKDLQPHHDKRDTLPHLRRITSKAGLNLARGTSVNDVAGMYSMYNMCNMY